MRADLARLRRIDNIGAPLPSLEDLKRQMPPANRH
jgi:hypothetical protein